MSAGQTGSGAVALDTPRLTLRRQRLDDFADSAAMWGDPAVTRHIGGRPFSAEESWARLHRNVGHWILHGYGYWVARERGSGRFVGEVGFADLHRDVEPALHGLPEAGWVLAPWAHGQGFATEAVRAALAFRDAHLPGTRTVCMIDPGNDGSVRVASKCGFREWTRTTYKGEPVVLYERVRDA